MHRFMKVMGKPGLLVADPFRARSDTPHFLGQRLKPVEADAKEDPDLNLADHFEPCEQIVKLDSAGRAHVLAALKLGEVVKLAECEAKDHGAAALKMAPKPEPAKSGKRGE